MCRIQDLTICWRAFLAYHLAWLWFLFAVSILYQTTEAHHSRNDLSFFLFISRPPEHSLQTSISVCARMDFLSEPQDPTPLQMIYDHSWAMNFQLMLMMLSHALVHKIFAGWKTRHMAAHASWHVLKKRDIGNVLSLLTSFVNQQWAALFHTAWHLYPILIQALNWSQPTFATCQQLFMKADAQSWSCWKIGEEIARTNVLQTTSLLHWFMCL